jgi:SAM-dependent methyltransferase
MQLEKQRVHDFWNDAACGENLYLRSPDAAGYAAHAQRRYELEPEIADLARFEDARGKRVLEIGVGLGADHARFAGAGADLYGIDLTERAIEHTRGRFAAIGLRSNVALGDAEQLAFPDSWFDIVYSWGVLHHSPNTARAIDEVYRVLKPDGEARIMIYHKWSLVGFMLWLRYAALRGRFWWSLTDVYSRYLESPGTKAYSTTEARHLFGRFRNVAIATHLTHADLLASEAGQRHRGVLLDIARRLWPRGILRRFFPAFGLAMTVTARK